MLFMKTSQTVKQMIVNSVVLYRASLVRVLVISFISAVITTVVNHVPQLVNMQDSTSGVRWLVILALVVSVFVVCYSSIIIMHQIMSVGRDERVPLATSIAYAHPRVLGLTMAIVVVYFFTAIGMVLFIIPGLFVITVTSMVMPLVIFKQVKPFTAIKASVELVWGNVFRTFGVIITPNAFIFIILTFAKLMHLSDLLLSVLEVIVMTFIGPWVFAAILVMYNELMLLHYAKQPEQS
ncbi:MAG: hypothetical protein P1U40_01335 [Coxiellaceae bacterium]|nr:hypothetical protein [Coxiellaceae bacterium]